MDRDSAIDALLNRLELEYDDTIANALRHHPRTRIRVAELIWQEYHKPSRSVLVHSMTDCFGFLNSQEPQDYLREAAFEDVGQKVRAIRGLAMFEPDTAFLAAHKALANPDTDDREQYPYLLLELNRQKAIPLLLSQAAQEESTAVIWAIGRALSGEDLVSTLGHWFASSETSERLAACRLSGWAKGGELLGDKLRILFDDLDEKVSKAARKALKRQRDQRESDILVNTIQSEQSSSRRWVLLDSLIAIADPGNQHQPLPAWAETIWPCLSMVMQKYLNDRLKERRKQMDDEAKKRDK